MVDSARPVSYTHLDVYKRQNPEIPVYPPDVKAYEVFDADGSFLAVLYMDFFPRASKRGGAWMTEFRQQGVENGVETRPLISRCV